MLLHYGLPFIMLFILFLSVLFVTSDIFSLIHLRLCLCVVVVFFFLFIFCHISKHWKMFSWFIYYDFVIINAAYATCLSWLYFCIYNRSWTPRWTKLNNTIRISQVIIVLSISFGLAVFLCGFIFAFYLVCNDIAATSKNMTM